MISIGDRLDGKYVVLRKLGSGGFGSVFLADDEALPGRQVAIKVLSRSIEGDQNSLWHEMQALDRFHHPHIVAFLHHFGIQQHPCLVMEHCPGGSLDDHLSNESNFSEEQVFAWGNTLCDTLGFVHEKGIVHHDIKPSNILLTANREIKLGDFGIANSYGGTLIYMPPEMLLRENVDRLDPRVDIYALGLTLLELLAGENPFISLSREQALQARIAHGFMPQSLPRWIQEVLLKATHPTPELRFQTMKDFGEAIRCRHVSYIFDRTRIKAETAARKARSFLEKGKRKKAQDLAEYALSQNPECVTALLVSGRCHLRIHHIERAQEYFSKAVAISPRTPVQRDLAAIALESNQIPLAISLLTDHLRRKATDYEAYNMLLKCFYLTERFEAGTDLARTLMDEKAPQDCFRSNEFLCRILSGACDLDEVERLSSLQEANPFIQHNLAVAAEQPPSWGGKIPLKAKLLFEEFEFSEETKRAKVNTIACELPDGTRFESDQTITTIGSKAGNDIIASDTSVSRRHCAVINAGDDVWLYDLGSTTGTMIGGRKILGRKYLYGVHETIIGRMKIRIASNRDLLI